MSNFYEQMQANRSNLNDTGMLINIGEQAILQDSIGENKEIKSFNEIIKLPLIDAMYEIDKLVNPKRPIIIRLYQEAIQNNRMDIVDYLNDKWPITNYINARSNFLYYAVLSNNIKIVKYLVETLKIMPTRHIMFKDDESSLIKAFELNNYDIVKYLLEHNFIIHKKNIGQIMQYIDKYENLDILALIHSKIDFSQLQDFKFTSYMVLRYFMERGFDPSILNNPSNQVKGWIQELKNLKHNKKLTTLTLENKLITDIIKMVEEWI